MAQWRRERLGISKHRTHSLNDMKDNQRKSMQLRLWQSLKILLITALLAGLIYRIGFAPTRVVEHQVTSGEIIAEVMGTGTLEARVKATISSKVSGLISKVLVDQGDRVSRGDLLVELDDEELSQQVAIAQANLAAKNAAIERLMSDKKRSAAILTQSTQLLDRMQRAIASRSVSQTDLDKANEMFAVAEAGLARSEAAITEGQKELIAAKETLQFRKAGLKNTKVLAPFDGLIVRRQRDPGDIVLPGSAVLKIVSTEQLWVSAWVDESEMAKIEPGQPARVIFRSEPNHPYSGKVTRLGRETDRESREFVVDVTVIESPENWAIGQRAEVYIEEGRKESAILIPAEFVQWQGTTSGVFVRTGNRAVWHSIKQGLRNDEFIEVIEGVHVGDAVVITAKSNARLRDGEKISLQ